MVYCPQSRSEPILRAAAQQRGCDVRYGAELVSFTQDETRVTAKLAQGHTSRSYVVRAEYLIAADGAHSPVRDALGIPTRGYGALPENIVFIYFRAPWQRLMAGHESDAGAGPQRWRAWPSTSSRAECFWLAMLLTPCPATKVWA